MLLFLTRHPGLESRLRSYFGDDIGPAHLKMADLPEVRCLPPNNTSYHPGLSLLFPTHPSLNPL